MGEKFIRYLLAITIGLGSIVVGYKFLAIDLSLSKKVEAPPVNVEPVFTTQTLPDEGGDAAAMAGEINNIIDTVNDAVSEPQTLPPAQPDQNAHREAMRVKIVQDIEAKGSKVVDSRIFVNKADCDTTVKKLFAEYRKRGVPKSDIVEADPFPDSTGAVIMFNINGQLYHAGCISPEHIDWAVYVQFVR